LNKFYLSQETDPYRNLAFENALFFGAGPGMTLYLWRNRDTVVIGRTQNAYAECRVSAIAADGGFLARRETGGGAVYHDTNNLNFTFVCPEAAFDIQRQLSVVLGAVRRFGVEAEFSGRNDILAGGRKFSGNAFRHSGGRALHHGTILLNTDTERMTRYLSASPGKMESKGVKSVASRVVNLQELCPGITPAALTEALLGSFKEVYGAYAAADAGEVYAGSLFAEKAALYASDVWRLGESPRFLTELRHRFSFGEVVLCLNVEGGVITGAEAYSDALDTEFILSLKAVLPGLAFSAEAAAEAVRSRLSAFPDAEALAGDMGKLMP
jgi:lipoate-protein ligase A